MNSRKNFVTNMNIMPVSTLKRKYPVILLILISAIFNIPELKADPARKEMPMEKYNFVRNSYKTDEIEFLMGNGEMGGLALKNGLGFEKLWFTDVWKDNQNRLPVTGPAFSIAGGDGQSFYPVKYHSELNIRYGILKTRVSLDNGVAYSSDIFFSQENKHRLVISIKNESPAKTIFLNILMTDPGYRIWQKSSVCIAAICKDTTSYTQSAWLLKSDKPVVLSGKRFNMALKQGESACFVYSLATRFDDRNYEQYVVNAVGPENNYITLEQNHIKNWDSRWKSIASVILPEGEYAKWFYRCIYTLYATAGAEKFLPAETQFSYPEPDWNMHHFTYGHAGWAIWDFAFLGDSENAEKMAKWHFKPEALKANVKILFPKTGPIELIYKKQSKGMVTYLDSYNPNAMAFGHEVTSDGYDIPYSTTSHWDLQRHVDAFGASMFHVVSQYFPNMDFLANYTYPVMRGTAEMWSSLVKWDSTKKFYYLPPLLSVSENIVEPSVLDAVLAARWNLKTSAGYALQLNMDKELQEKWIHIYRNLYVPANDSMYIEYLNDSLKRSGGGYFGIRAFMYLGFPTMETISDIDMKKARYSLDFTWNRNNKGEGMITFISNWFALTEAYLGNGNKAYEKSALATTAQDASGVALFEVFDRREDGTKKGINPYFLTGYSSFMLVPISMLLQSYNNTIDVFPAVPDHWKDVEFYDLPASQGIKVSGVLQAGKVKQVVFAKNGEELLQVDKKVKVEIRYIDNKLSLSELTK